MSKRKRILSSSSCGSDSLNILDETGDDGMCGDNLSDIADSRVEQIYSSSHDGSLIDSDNDSHDEATAPIPEPCTDSMQLNYLKDAEQLSNISRVSNQDYDESTNMSSVFGAANIQSDDPVNVLDISILEVADNDSDDESSCLQWKSEAPEMLYSSDEDDNNVNYDTDNPPIYDGASITLDEKKDDLKCPNLKLHPKNTDISYFVEIPLVPQLQTLFSQEEFCSNLSYRDERKKFKKENIEDIYDGQLYKELINCGFISSKNNNFSMILNSDGVPVFKASKKSLWPVFFNILELPPHLRFKKEYTMIGGLWFGTKPVANIIIGKLLPSLQQIRKGFGVQPFGRSETLLVRGVLLAATSDLPAKAMLMGMMTYSGAESCHMCKISGESVKISKEKKKKKKKTSKKPPTNLNFDQEENNEDIDLLNEKEKETYSSVWVFRYDKNRELRSHEESVSYGKLAQDQILATGNLKLHVCGFKQPSALFKVMYDGIRGFGIDDLHTLYLGVIKHLIKLWFDSKHHAEPFSIRKYVEVIDTRLKKIQPPNFLERGIRGIEEEFSYWNANECKTWAHFTSIPTLNGVLADKYLEHYIDLISCLQILVSSSISPQELLYCQKTLEEFVKQFEVLYGSRHMTMVIHMLLHLDLAVTNLGPMKSYSCFPYESLNGEILKMIHGTRYVETQLASGCFLISQLPHKLSSLKNAAVQDFCYRVLHPSLKLKKLENLATDPEKMFSVGTYREFQEQKHVLSALESAIELDPSVSIETYLRLKKGRTLFVSRSYTRCTNL
ncbi:hypothetical protein FOCC_FOCC010915 [Frankliniella occidentalis]|nr:hypothetical protein FOCC_FOCC010915 [Frankliniella occidentalis]